MPDASWDAELCRLDGHFLQSAEWQRVQSRLGHDVQTIAATGWSCASHLVTVRGIHYTYSGFGPTVGEGCLPDAIAGAVLLGRSAGADFIRIEPTGSVAIAALRGAGARKVEPHQPADTWVLDLDADEASLRAGLTKGHKGSINSAERKGLSFRTSTDPDDIGTLVELLRLTGARNAFSLHPESYYRVLAETLMPSGNAVLYIADADGGPVAAALAFDFNGRRHYAHAGADPERSRNLSAAAPLVWRMILDAKEAGMRQFDFWGVLPEGAPADHPWAGFSQFKRSFGGRQVSRAGTWEIPLRSWRYRVFRLGRRVLR